MLRLLIFVCPLLAGAFRSVDNYHAFEPKETTISHIEYSLTHWSQAVEHCRTSLASTTEPTGDALADAAGFFVRLLTFGQYPSPTWSCELPTPLRGEREELEPRLLMPPGANTRRVLLYHKNRDKWFVRIWFATRPDYARMEDALRTILDDRVSILANRVVL